ncbi:rhamnan synthesis F family protein [Propionispira raffinosivorans]|uniref:rhamnan synthesis F family protein n=1 Tax=Propionispira raffinosivorans TaxID=86959 RepID=UPI00036F3E2A|nr:rhamnan synthesis F family protein [Propionispira raffinosivorans]
MKQYILPFDENVASVQNLSDKKMGIFLDVPDIEFYHLALEYIERLDDRFEVFFYVEKDIVNEVINNKKNPVAYHFCADEKLALDFSSILNKTAHQMKAFDYICFLPVNREFLKHNTKAFLKSYRYCLMENLLKSSIYIQNLLDLFLKDKQISRIYPKEPVSLEYLRMKLNTLNVSVPDDSLSIFQRACWIRREKITRNSEFIEVQNNEYAAIYMDDLGYLIEKIDL